MIPQLYNKFFADKPTIPPPPASVFYNKEGFSVGEIGLHLLLEENHALVSSVTQHPVEDGKHIHDHIVNELRLGTLTGLVSNHSLNLAPDYTDFAEGEGVTRTPNYGSLSPRSINPAKDAWEQFKRLWQAKKLVTIVTGLEVYSDVAVTEVSTYRDGGSGEGLEFSVSFQQVNKAKLWDIKLQAVVAPLDMTTDINRQSSININNGKQVGRQSSFAIMGAE